MSAEFPTINKVAKTRDGSLIYNIHDIYIGRSIEHYGEFSHLETTLFDQLVRPKTLVVEMGANIGAHTVHLAKAVGPRGLVHAFEPQRMVFQVLCGNIALNNLTNVAAHHAAVGESAGDILVPALDFSKEQNFGGIGLGGYEQGERVKVVTLDSLQLEACHMIKADVEGMEEAALRGAAETIEKYQPILYFECDRKEKIASLLRYVDSLNYDLYWHRPPLFNPDNFLGNPENLFGDIISQNVLGVHRDKKSNIDGLPRVEIPPQDE